MPFHPMKASKTLFWILAPVLVLIQFYTASPSTPPIFNVHESVESLGNVVELQEAMAQLNIQKVVLQGIPKDILYYTEKKDLSLADSNDNNALIASVVQQTQNQDSFEYFCTIDPLDLERVEKMQECLANGGLGIKLYNGYSYTHVIPVDDARLSDLYQALSDAGGVLMLAINSGEYQGELENVLSLNPKLPVICPHYCLSSQSLGRLTDLMTRFPNLYIDTSFGKESLAHTGFTTISQNHDAFVSFFTEFQDRILFGTDNVVSDYENKDVEYLTGLYQNYIWILSKASFNTGLDDDSTVDYVGLNLPYSILRKVLWQNAATLLE